MGTFTITASGDGTFVAQATEYTFELFGPCGNVSGNGGSKGGPGGGARTKKVVPTVIGQTYNYHNGAAGENTWVIDDTTVKAVTGGDAVIDTTGGGTGGQAADCIGDPGESFSGGNGGNGHATGRGGGGGSSAGSAANGANGTNATAGAAGVGGTAPSGGGNGGNGGGAGQPGAAGQSPGGAPGGGATGQASGATSTGKIIATWVDVPTSVITSVSTKRRHRRG